MPLGNTILLTEAVGCAKKIKPVGVVYFIKVQPSHLDYTLDFGSGATFTTRRYGYLHFELHFIPDRF